jgi:hypothetical protein
MNERWPNVSNLRFRRVGALLILCSIKLSAPKIARQPDEFTLVISRLIIGPATTIIRSMDLIIVRRRSHPVVEMTIDHPGKLNR